MGMRQSDMIGIVGKTQDAVQTQHTNVRGHATQQDQLAVRQADQAERAQEQVAAAAPEDRVDLSAEWQGGAGADQDGGSKSKAEEEDPKPEPPASEPGDEHHIDFLA